MKAVIGPSTTKDDAVYILDLIQSFLRRNCLDDRIIAEN